MSRTTERSTTATDLAALPDALARRVWVADVRPCVDGGRHPIKRTVGEAVEVSADVLADGHDLLAAVVRYRGASDDDWRESPMRHQVNDRWRGSFAIERMEPYVYTVEAWIDRFASWRDGLGKKAAAGQDVTADLLEGAAILRDLAGRAEGTDRDLLLRCVGELEADDDPSGRVERAQSAAISEIARRWPDRSRATRWDGELCVEVNRRRALCGAWYEMFPRSAGEDPAQEPAGFAEARTRLPEIARMGFDVLYLPPIHPIGRRHRKGPNNALEAGPDDPGSPWAIGSAEGGHTAVHPGLGTLDDFDAFHEAARSAGLELALDIAFQCAPDHPWVGEHPQWFRHRPDGSIKYAENPPKKYQDIYPLDFECADWRGLWGALLDVVRFWADRGVRIFRVDNPHTKPIRFWGWLIPEIRATYPETVFLSEAFTRPKMMYALAKVGFDQSYTYFTWRNTKRDLIDYVTELTRGEPAEFFRPNFFANTPDILPEYLQFGGRPAFQVRLVLAATLAASYGIYSGFELCESEALPGTEEYRDSEKFQVRPRDWQAPGNLRDLVRRMNEIRRDNPALQRNGGLAFHEVDNEQMLFYSKRSADGANVILVVANLDPHNVHHGWVEVPLAELELGERETYQLHDLIGGGRYLWTGSRNYVRLDPQSFPAHIFRLRRKTRTERDFDYFM